MMRSGEARSRRFFVDFLPEVHMYRYKRWPNCSTYSCEEARLRLRMREA